MEEVNKLHAKSSKIESINNNISQRQFYIPK